MNKKTGPRIKELRLSYKLTQQELASMLHVSQQVVQKYEKGAIRPSIDTLIQMAQIFHTSIDYIVGLSDQRNVPPQ